MILKHLFLFSVESCMWKCLQSGLGSVSPYGWNFVWSSNSWSISRQIWKEKDLVHFIYRACHIWLCKLVCSNLQNICFTQISNRILYWWWNIISFCSGNRANWSFVPRICGNNGTMLFYNRTIDSSHCSVSCSWLEDVICSAFFTILCFYIVF